MSLALVRRGHDVVVETSNVLDWKTRRKVTAPLWKSVRGVRVHYHQSLFEFKTFFLTPRMISSIQKEILKCDIVHIHDPRSFQGIIASYYAKRTGTPYVVQPHGAILSMPPRSPLVRLLRSTVDSLLTRRILADAAGIIVLNQDERNKIESQLGICSSRVFTLPNGLDLDEYDTCHPADYDGTTTKLANDEKIILYLGRITHTKGIDLLIRATSILKTRYPLEHVRLVIAGPDADYKKHLVSLARSLDVIDRVTFTGFLSEEDKKLVLAKSDLFVTPSFTGFPISFLEAMASGLPIVTTTDADRLDFIHDHVGYIVDPTPESLAQGIIRILSSTELRTRMSRNAMALVKSKFSIDAITETLESIYREVLSRSR